VIGAARRWRVLVVRYRMPNHSCMNWTEKPPALRKAEWDRTPIEWRVKMARERNEYWKSSNER